MAGIQELLKKSITILDGGMGTMLQQKGMPLGTIPETLNLTKPDWIIDIHSQYIKAGSQIIYANTFGANRHKLADSGYTVAELIQSAIRNARIAAGGTDTFVALDIGPIGQLLEPTGSLSFEDAYDIFREMVVAGRDAGADLVIIETMTDLYEAKAAVLAARENSSLPVFVTMTFEENMRTFTGCSVSSMCITLEGLGVDALGVNCSLGPKDLLPIVEEIHRWTALPIIVKPNAGLPDPVTNAYNVLPDEFAQVTKQMLPYGVRILGGCCGTNPDYIKKISEAVRDTSDAAPDNKTSHTAVCTPLKTVLVDEPRIIGERINPTGKKRFRQALLDGDMDYILGQAVEQVEAGADILDVNVGAPGIDEKEMMVRTIKAIQSVIDVPLQIDSTKPEVIEAALRVYNGKPIVNSVNGEEAVMERILPLAAKYGAAIVCLTLDENGIPKTADGRFEIARRIMEKALSYGIKKEDILVDCLVLTVSAEQDAALITLEALHRVKAQLGLRTVLGVSNISFGLPNRQNINTSFLTMALYAGLDLPIMNPNLSAMMWAFKSYKVLSGDDENSLGFISFAKEHEAETAALQKIPALSITAPHPADCTCESCRAVFLAKAEYRKQTEGMGILKAMESGLKNEGRALTVALLKQKDSMTIINDILIPALDEVGDKFEKGKIFLPQLILAADVAKECFDVIKEELSRTDSASESKGKIILATVKGDIHDIGKNIVKVILENYGYDVIDLGKDVDPQIILKAAMEQKARLVGLSALMTTTLGSMEKTIQLLRENQVDCKIMVGGAVLTEDYALRIGADYYAKDAKTGADIARKVFG